MITTARSQTPTSTLPIRRRSRTGTGRAARPRSGGAALAGALPRVLALVLLAAIALLAGAGPAAAGEGASLTPNVAVPPAAGGVEALTLRIGDAIAHPDGLAVVVVRTYSSRPVGQGQLDFFARSRTAASQVKGAPRRPGARGRLAAGTGPLTLLGHLVFSSNGDVQSVIGGSQVNLEALRLRFTSPSGSVNDLDGPLAALFFRLAPDLVPGTVIDLDLDAAGTFLIDDRGEPVTVEVEPGVLLVRAIGGPRRVAADGDKVDPGETAELGVETFESFALAGGHVVLHYDPALAAGPPVVRFDRRYGRSSFTADVSTPGTIVVHFEAIEGSLNRIPGAFIQVSLPISPAAPRGTRSPLAIDRELSWLVPFGINGELPLQFVDGEIEIRE
jgi:hypothetical protein